MINFLTADIYSRLYEGQSRAVTNSINDILLDSVVNKTPVSNVVSQIEDLGVDSDQADLIVRNEQATLENKIREINYDEAEGSEDFLYYWAGPDDGRTTDMSKEIKFLSKDGLPKEELKALVRKVSRKYGFKPERDWWSHFQQRHTFLRYLGKKG